MAIDELRHEGEEGDEDLRVEEVRESRLAMRASGRGVPSARTGSVSDDPSILSAQGVSQSR